MLDLARQTILPIARTKLVDDIEFEAQRGTNCLLFSAVEAEDYKVGSQVKVEYSLRSVPMLWQKCYVHSVALADEAS